ncbi:unnamed protein product [Schistosoma bovis]|nr:unnamed protein product [Schistosoma bovis]
MKPPEIPLIGRIIIAIIVSLLVFISTLGNSLVLCVLNRKYSPSQQSHRKTQSIIQNCNKCNTLTSSMMDMKLIKHSVTYIFLMNLSISDLLHIIICAPLTLIADFLLIYWPFGQFLCRLINYLQSVVVFLCAFTHIIISIDRFTAIRYPIWRKHKLSITNAKLILLFIWCFAMIISIPSFIVCQLIITEDGLTYCQEIWSKYDWNQSNSNDILSFNHNPLNDSNDISLELIYNWLIILLQYILPLLVIIITYSAIVYQLWISTIPSECNIYQMERSRISKKLIIMVIIVASLYAISQLPRHIIYLITMNKPDAFEKDTIIYGWLLCQLSAWSATCYNPIVYVWMSRTFRRGLSEIFIDLCPCLNMHSTTQPTFKHCDKHYSTQSSLFNSKHNHHHHCSQHLQFHNQRRYFPYSKAATYNYNSSNNNIMKNTSQMENVKKHIVDEEYSSITTQYLNMKILDNTTVIKTNNNIDNHLK